MTSAQPLTIPGLAEVTIDTVDPETPVVEIRLLPEYRGDLNDIAAETPGPDDVYLRCNDTSALNNPALAKFMEVLHHWDTNGDGEADFDHVKNAIDVALWRSDDEPNVFHRPQSGYYTRLVMSMVPKAPKRHTVFSFGELRPRFCWYHHVAALPMLAFFIAAVLLQNEHLPFMKYSVVGGLQEIYTRLGVVSWLVLPLMIVTIILGMKLMAIGAKESPSPLSRHTYGFFNKAAVYEEQAFREGSESWSFAGRARSCVAFGLIHMVNLIYPLASILPLTVGGALLTWIYVRTYRKSQFRRTAVLEAAVWHRVYNRMALIAICVSLTIMIGLEVLVHFGIFAVVVGIGFAWQRFHFRDERSNEIVPEPVAVH